jgi:ribosomal protein S27E
MNGEKVVKTACFNCGHRQTVIYHEERPFEKFIDTCNSCGALVTEGDITKTDVWEEVKKAVEMSVREEWERFNFSFYARKDGKGVRITSPIFTHHMKDGEKVYLEKFYVIIREEK